MPTSTFDAVLDVDEELTGILEEIAVNVRAENDAAVRNTANRALIDEQEREILELQTALGIATGAAPDEAKPSGRKDLKRKAATEAPIDLQPVTTAKVPAKRAPKPMKPTKPAPAPPRQSSSSRRFPWA
ncbi:hypothetical protein C8R46DRAFT_1184817 [Mycena filopes]|nr:hypothetical protein C8R46DRAFT_1184817 [Mycena filopes]